MENDFTENIKKWVALDNKIKDLNFQIKELRQSKSDLAEKIFIKVEKDNLQNASINISDGKLRFTSIYQTAPLSLKTVSSTLESCLEDSEDVVNIINLIKKNRPTKLVSEIKRTYNKE